MTARTIFLLLSYLSAVVFAWETCNSVAFCSKNRKRPKLSDTLDFENVNINDTHVTGKITLNATARTTQLEFSVPADSTFRVVVDNVNLIPRRRREKEALVGELPALKFTHAKDDKAKTITVNHGKSKAIIYSDPFKIEFIHNEVLVSTLNNKNKLLFATEPLDTTVGIDITFADVHEAYGLPERAERLALRTTTSDDDLEPYRHFNVDYALYNVISTEALYGTIPVLYGHGPKQSSGIFWLNAAQTFVDITNGPGQLDAFFLSEHGVVEAFVFTGPTLPDAVKQYTKITGVAPLPQYFTLGYQQSRYSYMTQEEVIEVVDNFDKINIPLDVVWLDIDYSQNYRYFTWNKNTFPDPAKLLQDLTQKERKLVAIIDPHIKYEKFENVYPVYDECRKKNYFVKVRSDGVKIDYIAKCWPGDSSWIDFTNPEARAYYASLYNSEPLFNHPNLHIWNDMNEPAVFEVSENAMPDDAIHHEGPTKEERLHKELHNVYGLYQTIGTRTGLLARKENLRPFILTRSHFAGIQRYAAVWTGDNKAEWRYLQISFPMCLTEALAGVSFCGADVAGFKGIPTDELYQRWYQAGAWLPFYRGHSAVDVPRREPYLYPSDIQKRIRTAIQQRYSHLPVWYTLFYEHEQTGVPVIRPITYHYPTESDALNIDDHILVGRNILAAPVLTEGAVYRELYLPGGKNEIWYNVDDDFRIVNGSGHHVVQVNLDSIPVFYRGGSIIPRKDTPRKSSVGTFKDPFTLYICPDINGTAEGTLFIDDYTSFEYSKTKRRLYLQFNYHSNGSLVSKLIDDGQYDDYEGTVDKIIMLNPNIKNITDVSFNGERIDDSVTIHFNYTEEKHLLRVYDISAALKEPFELTLNGANIIHLSLALLFTTTLVILRM